MKVSHKEESETVNVFGVSKQEEMFKSGVHVEHFWIRRLKEMF